MIVNIRSLPLLAIIRISTCLKQPSLRYSPCLHSITLNHRNTIHNWWIDSIQSFNLFSQMCPHQSQTTQFILNVHFCTFAYGLRSHACYHFSFVVLHCPLWDCIQTAHSFVCFRHISCPTVFSTLWIYISAQRALHFAEKLFNNNFSSSALFSVYCKWLAVF